MPDDKTKTGGQDRIRIATGAPYEVRDWARKFAVTEQQLLDAVRNVGDAAADVEAYLNKQRN